MPGAVEELIRWVTPLNNLFRTATRDTTLAGTDIAAGDRHGYDDQISSGAGLDPN